MAQSNMVELHQFKREAAQKEKDREHTSIPSGSQAVACKSLAKDSKVILMLKYLLIVIILFSCKVDWKAMPYGHMHHHWSLYSQSDTMVVHKCDKVIMDDVRCPAKDTFYFRRY